MCRGSPPPFSKVVRVTNNGTALAAVAAGALSADCTVEFQQAGVVTGMAGVSLGDGTVGAMSSLALRLLINERDRALTRNKTSEDYLLFAYLFGLQGQREAPLGRKVIDHQKYSATFQHVAAAGGPWIPELDFFFLDRELAELSDRYRSFFAASQADPNARPDYSVGTFAQAVHGYLRVTGFPVLTAGAGLNATPIVFEFQEEGLVVGLSGVAVGSGTAAGMASLGVQISPADMSQAITSNGQGLDVANFGCLFGLDGSRVAPLLRRVRRNEKWTFQVRNDSQAGVAYTPEMGIWFVDRRLALMDPDLAVFVGGR